MKFGQFNLKTLENFLRVGLLDEESFNDKNLYLDEANSSLFTSMES